MSEEVKSKQANERELIVHVVGEGESAAYPTTSEIVNSSLARHITSACSDGWRLHDGGLEVHAARERLGLR